MTGRPVPTTSGRPHTPPAGLPRVCYWCGLDPAWHGYERVSAGLWRCESCGGCLAADDKEAPR